MSIFACIGPTNLAPQSSHSGASRLNPVRQDPHRTPEVHLGAGCADSSRSGLNLQRRYDSAGADDAVERRCLDSGRLAAAAGVVGSDGATDGRGCGGDAGDLLSWKMLVSSGDAMNTRTSPGPEERNGTVKSKAGT